MCEALSFTKQAHAGVAYILSQPLDLLLLVVYALSLGLCGSSQRRQLPIPCRQCQGLLTALRHTSCGAWGYCRLAILFMHL